MERNSVLIAAIMEKAEIDPILRARLLTDPQSVAAEYKTEFGSDEVAYLKNIGGLYKAVDELHAIPHHGPIYYPARKWAAKKISVITLPNLGNPGYYIDIARFRQYLEYQQAEQLAAKAVAAK